MAFTTQNDFGKEAREAAWATQQRTLHGLNSADAKLFDNKQSFRDMNMMADEARRRAEIARYADYIIHLCSFSFSEFFYCIPFTMLFL